MPKQKERGKEHSSRRWPDKNTHEYNEKRAQNNVAVKRSREKAKMRQMETCDRVDGLRKENQELEGKVQTLQKELSVLKDLFTSHASGATKSVPKPMKEESPSGNPIQLDHQYSTT